MQIFTTTPEAYTEQLSDERRIIIEKLRITIKSNIPDGFQEVVSYGMIGYVVPHTLYPSGYHCDPKQPLPFISIASQKNFVAFYHMGIYADPNLLNWFLNEFSKISNKKPDMGKSCIRFKKPDDIPYELIGELVSRISVSEWIAYYEQHIKK